MKMLELYVLIGHTLILHDNISLYVCNTIS